MREEDTWRERGIERERKRNNCEKREKEVKERASVGGLGFAQRPWLLSFSSSSSSSFLLHTFTLSCSLLLLLNLVYLCTHIFIPPSTHYLFSLPFFLLAHTFGSISDQIWFYLFKCKAAGWGEECGLLANKTLQDQFMMKHDNLETW